jgi:hypothetical protein
VAHKESVLGFYFGRSPVVVFNDYNVVGLSALSFSAKKLKKDAASIPNA